MGKGQRPELTLAGSKGSARNLDSAIAPLHTAAPRILQKIGLSELAAVTMCAERGRNWAAQRRRSGLADMVIQHTTDPIPVPAQALWA